MPGEEIYGSSLALDIIEEALEEINEITASRMRITGVEAPFAINSVPFRIGQHVSKSAGRIASNLYLITESLLQMLCCNGI